MIKLIDRAYNYLAKQFYYYPFYSHEKYYLHQNSLFKDNFHQDYHFFSEKFDLLRLKHSEFFNRMSSDHLILFIALSLTNEIKNILEIGTYDGKNVFLMSKIFTDYNYIKTIDLPDDSPIFKSFYGRQKEKFRKQFIMNRNEILSKISNLDFIMESSVSLISDKHKYDLIWLDGDHNYPVATIDIINSLNLINKDGYILCDDVYIEHIPYPNIYESDSTYETLKVLKDSGLIEYTLFYKRLDKINNAFPKTRKFIALIKKI